jgi:HSP20 family protein
LQRDFDTLFGRLFSDWLVPFDQDIVRVWDFDVSENDHEIIVRAEIPGFEEKELDVQLANGVLTIKGEKEQKANGREEYRNFFRSVTLPPGINADKVQATYRNGVLELHIPRAEEAKPKHIQVRGQEALSNQNATGSQSAGQAQQPKK